MPLMERHSLLFLSLLATAVLALYIISNITENGPSKFSQMLLWKDAVSNNEKESTATSREKLKSEEITSLSYAEKQFKLYDGVETFVMFIGYHASGHSLVGTVLDAHPEIIIPHEYDIIKYWEKYQSSRLQQKNMQKYQLFFDLHQFSREQALFGLRAPTYNFHIPGLWQGGYENKIKVIGDKKGGDTALAIRNLSSLHIFEEISQVAQAPIKFIHVIRNPFDDIATMLLRFLLIDPYVASRKEGVKIENNEELDWSIDEYFKMAESNQRVRERYGDAVLDIPGHETVLRPRETLQRLCDHLGVMCSEDYLQRCSKILAGPRSKQLSFTRNSVVWTEEQKQRVTETKKRFLYLKQFSFDKYPS